MAAWGAQYDGLPGFPWMSSGQGCVHMTCNPRCQHEFCWLCLCGWTSVTHDASEASHWEVLASVKAALKPAEEIEELHLDPATARAAMDGWNTFVSMSESREITGEVIYAALFEGAPSLQSLFTTPRAVQAMRFMNGLMSFVMALEDPPHLDVMALRVVILLDAILGLVHG